MPRRTPTLKEVETELAELTHSAKFPDAHLVDPDQGADQQALVAGMDCPRVPSQIHSSMKF